MHKLALSLAVPLLVVLASAAQKSPPSQVELNGFILGQYAKAADGAFGNPTQVRGTEDHWSYRVYLFDKKHNAYMAFKFPPGDLERMISIQIAGDKGTPMRPFLGLVLGGDKLKVQQVLGTPAKIEPEKDSDVDLYTYADRNYSVEINRQGKLSSIQVMGYTGFAERPASTLPAVDSFRESIVSRSVDRLLTFLGGDLEIYRGEQTYTFAKSARAELEDSHSEIARLFFGEKDSLWAAFTTEKFEPDEQIRLYTEASPGSVAKFEHSKILREVVFKMEAGTWKVWEIRLR